MMDSERKECLSGECTGRLAQHGVSTCGNKPPLSLSLSLAS